MEGGLWVPHALRRNARALGAGHFMKINEISHPNRQCNFLRHLQNGKTIACQSSMSLAGHGGCRCRWVPVGRFVRRRCSTGQDGPVDSDNFDTVKAVNRMTSP